MTNKQLAKELRCLRMHLSPLCIPEKLNFLEEAERRLENGVDSSTPAPSLRKKKNNQGKRTTKQQAYNQFLNK